MERFAAIDFETANGKRSSICSIGIAILEDDWVVDSIYTLVRPTPNFYTRWTTAIHGLTAEDTNDALCFEEAWESIAQIVTAIRSRVSDTQWLTAGRGHRVHFRVTVVLSRKSDRLTIRGETGKHLIPHIRCQSLCLTTCSRDLI